MRYTCRTEKRRDGERIRDLRNRSVQYLLRLTRTPVLWSIVVAQPVESLVLAPVQQYILQAVKQKQDPVLP
jgi:hypothetical protein